MDLNGIMGIIHVYGIVLYEKSIVFDIITRD